MTASTLSAAWMPTRRLDTPDGDGGIVNGLLRSSERKSKEYLVPTRLQRPPRSHASPWHHDHAGCLLVAAPSLAAPTLPCG